jgi:flagellar motor protein MotB
MAKKKESDPPPAWLTTMSDMNTLLMTFFIMLFAMMSRDRTKFLRLGDQLEQMGVNKNLSQEPGLRKEIGEVVKLMETYLVQDKAAVMDIQLEGQYYRVARTTEGTVITLGGEFDPYDEGQWEVRTSNTKILDTIKRWLKGRRNIIRVRGHTAENLEDSVVVEKYRDPTAGQTLHRIRKFEMATDGKAEDRMERANHHLLSHLRATEVMRYLTQEHLEGKIREDLIDLQAVGPWQPVVPAAMNALEHRRNRRVEIVVLSTVREE